MTVNGFTRLNARRRGFVRRASIWDAGEYLLSVSGTAFSERYHRYYFRDIKAIVVQKGPRLGSMGGLALLVFMAFTFGIVVATNPHVPLLAHLFWLGPLIWVAIMMYMNLAQSCRVYIYTAVSSEELPAIFRQASARRVVPQILEKIRESQGSLGIAPAKADIDNEVASATETPRLAAGTKLETAPLNAPEQTLYACIAYFGVLLASAAFAYWYRDALLTPASLLAAKVLFCALNAFGVAAGVWALVGVFRVRLLNSVRLAIFCGLGLLLARAYALYFTLIALKVQHGSLTESMTAVRWRQGLGAMDCALSLIIAIAGFIALSFTWLRQPGISTPAVPENSITGGPLSNP